MWRRSSGASESSASGAMPTKESNEASRSVSSLTTRSLCVGKPSNSRSAMPRSCTHPYPGAIVGCTGSRRGTFPALAAVRNHPATTTATVENTTRELPSPSACGRGPGVVFEAPLAASNHSRGISAPSPGTAIPSFRGLSIVFFLLRQFFFPGPFLSPACRWGACS